MRSLTLEHAGTHCNTLQRTATHGNTRQHTLFLFYPRSHIDTYAHTHVHTHARVHVTSTLSHTCKHAHAHTFLISPFSTFTHTRTHAPLQLKERKLCIHKHYKKKTLHAQTTSANTNTKATKNENRAYTCVYTNSQKNLCIRQHSNNSAYTNNKKKTACCGREFAVGLQR